MAMNDIKNTYIQKEELNLRPLETTDAEFMKNNLNKKQIRNKIGRPPYPTNQNMEEDYIEETTSSDETVNLIIEKNGEKAGHIFLANINMTYRRAEIGYFITPEFQKEGIATKALEAILEYAFEDLNLHKVRGGYLEGNPASRKVMERNNMKEEGRERHYKYVNGEWKDVIFLSILENEYKQEK